MPMTKGDSMGEIRSTLDIIMEKTRGLSMSEQEKNAIKTQEMTGKIKGLIQKFLDGVLDIDTLKIEVTALTEEDQDMVERMIIEECIPRIRLGENNEPILKILEGTAGSYGTPFRDILKGFEDRLKRDKAVREKELKQALEHKGISGTAVIPNIQASSEWVQYVSEMKERLKQQLTSYSKELKD